MATGSNPGESSSSSSKTPPAPTMVTVTDAHFTQLMNVIKESRTAIDMKLAAFKAELQDSQERAATLAARSCPTGALLLQKEVTRGTT